jgi:ABC-2 type transport system ATP-binding protein
MAGGVRPDAGSVFLDDENLYTGDLRWSRSRIGYLPERPLLYDFLTAREFLSFVASVKMTSVDTYLHMAGQLNMSGHLDNRMDALSNGQRRKVTLIACLMNRPDYLILDEPTNAFDQQAIGYIREVVNTYLRENKVVIFSTHDLDFLNEFGQYIYKLEGGSLHLNDGSISAP